MRKQWIPGPFLSPREKGLGTRLDQTYPAIPECESLARARLANASRLVYELYSKRIVEQGLG